MANGDLAASAAKLSKVGAQKGGHARAAKLTAAERSEAARQAAETRWGTALADATHTGRLVIGDVVIDCAVLSDGTRVLSQGTVLAALNRAPSMGRREITDGRPPFLSAANLRPFISKELVDLWEPVTYRLPGTGSRSVGYRAEILPMVCEVYLDARTEEVLLHNQFAAANAAELLIRGLARVGIIALVDEATGYQELRARHELQKILEAYVQVEFRRWVQTFPDEFFRQVYRLMGWEFRPGTSKRTPHVGKLIKHYIYEQLPPGVLEELERVNPRNEKGYRARKHHQHLTESTGNVHLDRQITTVMTLMRIAQDRTEFEALFDRAFPPAQTRLPLVVEVSDEDGPTRSRLVS